MLILCNHLPPPRLIFEKLVFIENRIIISHKTIMKKFGATAAPEGLATLLPLCLIQLGNGTHTPCHFWSPL
jgi:hypothetical protein